MKASSSKSKVECSLGVGTGILFMSDGWLVREMDRWIGASSVVMRALRSVVAKVSIYCSICVPTLTYGHEIWVMTRSMRLRIQAAEMGFLQRVAWLSVRDRVRSSTIRRELEVEPLLLYIKRSQVRWFGHLVRMPPGYLPLGGFQAHPTGRRPQGRPRNHWRYYMYLLPSVVVLEIGLVSVSDKVGSGFYFKTTTVGMSINYLCIFGFTC